MLTEPAGSAAGCLRSRPFECAELAKRQAFLDTMQALQRAHHPNILALAALASLGKATWHSHVSLFSSLPSQTDRLTGPVTDAIPIRACCITHENVERRHWTLTSWRHYSLEPAHSGEISVQ